MVAGPYGGPVTIIDLDEAAYDNSSIWDVIPFTFTQLATDPVAVRELRAVIQRFEEEGRTKGKRKTILAAVLAPVLGGGALLGLAFFGWRYGRRLWASKHDNAGKQGGGDAAECGFYNAHSGASTSDPGVGLTHTPDSNSEIVPVELRGDSAATQPYSYHPHFPYHLSPPRVSLGASVIGAIQVQNLTGIGVMFVGCGVEGLGFRRVGHLRGGRWHGGNVGCLVLDI